MDANTKIAVDREQRGTDRRENGEMPICHRCVIFDPRCRLGLLVSAAGIASSRGPGVDRMWKFRQLAGT
jgi:hypothetical protein